MQRAILLFAFVMLLAGCGQPPANGTAITNVTVIDAVNGIREQQTVIFDGDEIVTIQSSDAAVAAAETIDGSGKFLIPGLWDFHVHLTYDDRFTDYMPELFLSYGITSVRDTGGLMRKVLPVVEKMRAPGAVAPRVFFAGPLLDGNFVVYDGESRPEIGVRNATPDDARKTIADLKSQGVDFIKIYEMVSPAVFDAMVETAQQLGLPIDSHVPLSLRAGTAGPSVDSIEHLRNIEMDCAANAPELHETRLELLRNPDGLSGADLRSSLHSLQRQSAIAAYDEARCDRVLDALTSTTQVPTLRLAALNLAPPFLRDDWQDALSRIRADAREDWIESAANIAANPIEEFTTFGEWALFLTGRMHERGIPIGAGTDTPIFLAVPGYSLHSELEYLVRAGLSPLEALESATVRPAEFFSLQDEMGTVDVGKKADLVLLDANPLDNIANTRSIAAVVSKGTVYTSEELTAMVSAAHSSAPTAAASQAVAQLPGSGAVAYTGATVWDGTGTAPLSNATLVVSDGRVVSVGNEAAPEGAGIVDLEGRWIVPGFINAHGHASGRWAADDIQGDAARVEGDLALYARYGVTTVLSLGGIPADAYRVRETQSGDTLDRARLLLAGEIVFSQDPAEAAAMTRSNIDAGVDWIKLRVDDNLGSGEKMSWDAVLAAMTVAKAANVPVASHIFYMDDAATLLGMGTRLVAHSVRDQRLSNEFVQTLLDSGVCYVPTLVREVSTFVYGERPAFFDDPFFLEAAKQSQIDRVSAPEFMSRMAASPAAEAYRKALVQAQENLRIAVDSGVPVAFGTDSGPAGRFPGYFEHMEFDLMGEAGMTAEEILSSATSVAADCLDLDDLGTLEPGKWADFVVLAQDPLADVQSLHSVQDAYVAGNKVAR